MPSALATACQCGKPHPVPAPLAERERRPHDGDKCHICQGQPELGALVWLFGAWMCRDRVECYQRFKRGIGKRP